MHTAFDVIKIAANEVKTLLWVILTHSVLLGVVKMNIILLRTKPTTFQNFSNAGCLVQMAYL